MSTCNINVLNTRIDKFIDSIKGLIRQETVFSEIKTFSSSFNESIHKSFNLIGYVSVTPMKLYPWKPYYMVDIHWYVQPLTYLIQVNQSSNLCAYTASRQ